MPKNLVWNNHNKKSDSWPWKEPGFSAEHGFSTAALLKFGVRWFFAVRAVLCAVGRLAASKYAAHEMLQVCFQTLPNVPWGQNQSQLRTTVVETVLRVLQWILPIKQPTHKRRLNTLRERSLSFPILIFYWCYLLNVYVTYWNKCSVKALCLSCVPLCL